MLIRVLPLVAGVLPVIGVGAAYWLNVRAGVLPSCNPFLDGCTSISSAGRYMPGSIPFRATLLPQAVLLVFLWYLSVGRLRHLKSPAKLRNIITISGMLGAIALIVYVTFLGTKHPFYEFMRRFGIYVYFLGTTVAQLSLTLAMHRSRLRRAMIWVVIAPFGLGVLNLIQKAVLSTSNGFQNRVEWIAALLMQVWFVFLFMQWRRFSIEITVLPRENT